MITSTPRRWPARSAAALVLATTTVSAGAAHAAVPENWSDPEAVSPLTVLWMLIGIPVGLIVLIALLVYLPSMVRGESLSAVPQRPEDQWFGGPRKGTEELAEPDTAESKAGGASGRW